MGEDGFLEPLGDVGFANVDSESGLFRVRGFGEA